MHLGYYLEEKEKVVASLIFLDLQQHKRINIESVNGNRFIRKGNHSLHFEIFPISFFESRE